MTSETCTTEAIAEAEPQRVNTPAQKVFSAIGYIPLVAFAVFALSLFGLFAVPLFGSTGIYSYTAAVQAYPKLKACLIVLYVFLACSALYTAGIAVAVFGKKKSPGRHETLTVILPFYSLIFYIPAFATSIAVTSYTWGAGYGGLILNLVTDACLALTIICAATRAIWGKVCPKYKAREEAADESIVPVKKKKGRNLAAEFFVAIAMRRDVIIATAGLVLAIVGVAVPWFRSSGLFSFEIKGFGKLINPSLLMAAKSMAILAVIFSALCLAMTLLRSIGVLKASSGVRGFVSIFTLLLGFIAFILGLLFAERLSLHLSIEAGESVGSMLGSSSGAVLLLCGSFIAALGFIHPVYALEETREFWRRFGQGVKAAVAWIGLYGPMLFTLGGVALGVSGICLKWFTSNGMGTTLFNIYGLGQLSGIPSVIVEVSALLALAGTIVCCVLTILETLGVRDFNLGVRLGAFIPTLVFALVTFGLTLGMSFKLSLVSPGVGFYLLFAGAILSAIWFQANRSVRQLSELRIFNT